MGPSVVGFITKQYRDVLTVLTTDRKQSPWAAKEIQHIALAALAFYFGSMFIITNFMSLVSFTVLHDLVVIPTNIAKQERNETGIQALLPGINHLLSGNVRSGFTNITNAAVSEFTAYFNLSNPLLEGTFSYTIYKAIPQKNPYLIKVKNVVSSATETMKEQTRKLAGSIKTNEFFKKFRSLFTN